MGSNDFNRNRLTLDYIMAMRRAAGNAAERARLETEFKEKRFAAADKARRTRPLYYPLHFTFGLPARVTPYALPSPDVNIDATILAFSHNFEEGNYTAPTYRMNMRILSSERPFTSTGAGDNVLPLPEHFGAKGQFATALPMRYLRHPIDLGTRRRLIVEVHKLLVTGAEQKRFFNLVGLRHLPTLEMSATEAEELRGHIAQYDTPEPRLLTMTFNYGAGVAASGIEKTAETTPQDEPLLIHGVSQVGFQWSVLREILIKGEANWLSGDMPVTALALALTGGEEIYTRFEQSFLLPAGNTISARVVNSGAVENPAGATYDPAELPSLIFEASTL